MNTVYIISEKNVRLQRRRAYATNPSSHGISLEVVRYDARHMGSRASRSKEYLHHQLVEQVVSYAILTMDPDGVILSWNQEAERTFGWSAAEAVGRSAAIIFGEEDRAAGVPQQEMQQALRDGCARDNRWHVHKDGRRIWVNGTVTPLRDDEGELIGFGKVVRDRTTGKRLERTLRESNERYEALVSASAQIVWTTDASGMVIEDSPSGRAFTGLSREAWAGRGWLDAVHPEDRERAGRGWFESVRSGTRHEAEFRLKHVSGEWRWMQVRAAPVRDDAGRVTSWVGMNTDVHDRVRAEAALRRSEEWHRTSLNALPDFVWTTDVHGDTTFINDRWSDFTGLPRSAGMGDKWPASIHPEDVATTMQAWEAVRDLRKPFEAEHRIRAANGEYRWFLARSNPVFDASGELVEWIGTSTDIHQHQMIRLELQKRRKQQSVVVQLGMLALSSDDLDDIMRFAAKCIRETLEVDCSSVLELQGDHIVFAAAEGWPTEEIWDVRAPATPDTQAGYTVITRSFVTVEDNENEPRFRNHPLIRQAGIVSSISTVIANAGMTYGVVAAHSTAKRTFTEDEKTFLQAVANTLSEAFAYRRSQRALNETQERMVRILESIQEAFCSLDHEWRFTYVNKQAERQLRRTADELLGTSLWDAFPDALGSQFEQAYRQAAERRQPVYFEEYYPPLGTWFEVHAYPFEDGLSVFLLNINERKQAEEERRRLELERALDEQMLEERKRVGRELHDGVRQQLVGIRMLAGSLQKRLAAQAPAEARLMETFVDLVTDANQQVRELIHGLVPPTITAEHLPAALERAARNVEQWHGVHCTVTAAEGAETVTDDVATHLYHIAFEAMMNAAKHSKASQIEASLRAKDGSLVLQVNDDGIGLPDDYDKRGSLGISSMRSRAQLVDATITLKSRPNEGTSVRCVLPLPPAS